jgi:hypothetical protein
MDEYIVAAVIRLDKAETLLTVEPLNCTCRNIGTSRGGLA